MYIINIIGFDEDNETNATHFLIRFQIKPDARCDADTLAIFSTLQVGYNEQFIRNQLVRSMMRGAESVNTEILRKIGPRGRETFDVAVMGTDIISKFREFDLNAIFENFRTKLQSMSRFTDANAMSKSAVGRDLYQFCSKHWNDVEGQKNKTLAQLAEMQMNTN